MVFLPRKIKFICFNFLNGIGKFLSEFIGFFPTYFLVCKEKGGLAYTVIGIINKVR